MSLVYMHATPTREMPPPIMCQECHKAKFGTINKCREGYFCTRWHEIAATEEEGFTCECGKVINWKDK